MRTLLLAACLATFPLPAAAQGLSGTWTVQASVKSGGIYNDSCFADAVKEGIGDRTLVAADRLRLSVSGSSVSGHVVDQNGNQVGQVAGTVNGHAVHFSIGHFPDQPIDRWEIESCGTADLLGGSTSTWTYDALHSAFMGVLHAHPEHGVKRLSFCV